MARATVEAQVSLKWWFRIIREPMIATLYLLMALGVVTERQAVEFVAWVIKRGVRVTVRGQ